MNTELRSIKNIFSRLLRRNKTVYLITTLNGKE